MEIIRKLGEGMFAEVFLVREDQQTKRVIKKFKSANQAEARREFFFLQAAANDYVVTTYQYREKDSIELILEYVEGPSLQNYQPNDESSLRKLMGQIARGLARIHAQGICINDIKPDNIIWHENHPIFIDFGLATVNGYDDQIFRGNIAFAAPEKRQYQKNHFPADVFALGILYDFLTRRTTVAAEMDPKEYEDLLLDAEKWNGFWQQKDIPDFVKTMVDFCAAKRPIAYQVAQYFEDGSISENLEDHLLSVNSYVFASQIEAAHRWQKQRHLDCAWYDEPEKIAQIFCLNCETQNQTAYVLREQDFVVNTQSFLDDVTRWSRQEINNGQSLSDWIQISPNIIFVLIRSSNHTTLLFDKLSRYPNIWGLTIGEKSELSSIDEQEFRQLYHWLSIQKQTETWEKLTVKRPFFGRSIMIMQHDDSIANQSMLAPVLASLQLPIPQSLLWDLGDEYRLDWLRLFQQKQMRMQGNHFVWEGKEDCQSNLSPALLLQMKTIAEKHAFAAQAGQLAWLACQQDQAWKHWQQHIETLIKAGQTLAALAFLQWIGHSHKVILPFSLLKKKAFLWRVGGFYQAAIDLYGQLLQQTDGKEKAVLQVDQAVALQQDGQLDAAIQAYRTGNEMFRLLEDIVGILRTENNLGAILYDLSRFAEAEESFQKVLRLSKTASNETYRINYQILAYLNLGDVYQRRGEWATSLRYANSATALAGKYGKIHFQAYAQGIAWFNQFALNPQETSMNSLQELLASEPVQENVQLKQMLALRFLWVALLQNDVVSIRDFSISSVLSNDDFLTIVLHFFLAWHHQQFDQMQKMQDLHAETVAGTVISALMQHNEEAVWSVLESLLEHNDIFAFWLVASLTLRFWRLKSTSTLKQEIESFRQFHPFPKNDYGHDQLMMQWLQALQRWQEPILQHVSEEEYRQELLDRFLAFPQLKKIAYWQKQEGAWHLQAAKTDNNENWTPHFPKINLQENENICQRLACKMDSWVTQWIVKNDILITQGLFLLEIESDFSMDVWQHLFTWLLEMSSQRQPSNQDLPEHFAAFWQLVEEIHSNVDPKKTLFSVMKAILTISGCERAVYFRFVNNAFHAETAINQAFDAIDVKTLRVSQTVLQKTLQTKQIQFFTNLQEETEFNVYSSILGLGLRSAICFPFIMNQRIEGVLYVDATGENYFSDDVQRMTEHIWIQARAALERSHLFSELQRESQTTQKSLPQSMYQEMVGESPEMRKIFALIEQVGEHNVNVLISGPTGSGKELIARALHQKFNAKAPFIAVNCAAIPDNLLESELFGYEKGAFTGANSARKGKISAADGGTLFLDEIGDMSLALQAKLLRVLQEKKVIPIGRTEGIEVNFRVIAASNRDLQEQIRKEQFREDLLYRLNVIQMTLPSLDRRKMDIPLLVHHFIQKFNQKFQKKIDAVSPDAIQFLQSRDWPGNVRELENVVERAVLLCQESILTAALFRETNSDKPVSIFEEIPENWEEYKRYKSRMMTALDKSYAQHLLNKTNGNVNQASQLGQINRKQMYRIMDLGGKKDSK